MKGKEVALAVISVYSHPDSTLLLDSFGTLRVCKYLGKNHLFVIEATTIESVVGMIPFPLSPRELEAEDLDTSRKFADCFYVAEKLSLATPDDLEDDEDEVDI